jgi:hypothetical protein
MVLIHQTHFNVDITTVHLRAEFYTIQRAEKKSPFLA